MSQDRLTTKQLHYLSWQTGGVHPSLNNDDNFHGYTLSDLDHTIQVKSLYQEYGRVCRN